MYHLRCEDGEGLQDPGNFPNELFAFDQQGKCLSVEVVGFGLSADDLRVVLDLAQLVGGVESEPTRRLRWEPRFDRAEVTMDVAEYSTRLCHLFKRQGSRRRASIRPFEQDEHRVATRADQVLGASRDDPRSRYAAVAREHGEFERLSFFVRVCVPGILLDEEPALRRAQGPVPGATPSVHAAHRQRSQGVVAGYIGKNRIPFVSHYAPGARSAPRSTRCRGRGGRTSRSFRRGTPAARSARRSAAPGPSPRSARW